MTQTLLHAVAVLKTSIGSGAIALAVVYLAAWLLTWRAKAKASA